MAKQYGLMYVKDTHFEAINREVVLHKRGAVQRLDFTYLPERGVLTVTKYIDSYSGLAARLCARLLDYLPIKQKLVNTSYERIAEIPLPAEGSVDSSQLNRIFHQFLQGGGPGQQA